LCVLRLARLPFIRVEVIKDCDFTLKTTQTGGADVLAVIPAGLGTVHLVGQFFLPNAAAGGVEGKGKYNVLRRTIKTDLTQRAREAEDRGQPPTAVGFRA
jgi:hypothetical protein